MVLSLKAWKSRSLPGLPRTEFPSSRCNDLARWPPEMAAIGFFMHQGPAVRNLPEHRAREPIVQAGDFADHHRPALEADEMCHIRPEVAKLATYATLVA